MKIMITAEATSDYPERLLTPNVTIFPMGYTVGGVAYDGVENKLSPKEFYDACRKAKTKEDLPQTTMITAYQAQEYFRPLLEDGYDIIHIGFTKSLSGTYDQMCMAAKELSAQYPKRKITIIESCCAAFVQGLLVWYVDQKLQSGASYDELVTYAEDLKNHCAGYFTIDDMKHLYRTGRASKTQAFLGDALQIKPILYINKVGKLIPISKQISHKKAMRTMLDYLDKKMLPVQEQKLVAVMHADAYDDALLLEKTIKEKYNFERTEIVDVGPVIGSHVGAGMLAFIFLCTDKIEPNDKSMEEEA
ncbi:MAG: DegV family protein [Clostridia bacterium]|nr:DegV family protein [Clostridia bacterium]MDE7329393.1 DegV family protein [Clostridia bacterium]